MSRVFGGWRWRVKGVLESHEGEKVIGHAVRH